MEAVFLFGLFILLLMLSVPIGYAIGMVTLVTMLHFTSMPTLMIAQNSIAGVDSFPLLAIPFFMLAGNLMSGGGIAKRLVNFLNALLGILRVDLVWSPLLSACFCSNFRFCSSNRIGSGGFHDSPNGGAWL